MFSVLWLALLVQTFAWEITGISTRIGTNNQGNLVGSIAGGTRLYFRGDFDAMDFSKLKISIGTGECVIREFFSNDYFVDCETPPAEIGELNVPITVVYDQTTTIPTEGRSFEYKIGRSPYILFVNPPEACPEDEIEFVGKFRTTNHLHYEEALIKGRQMEILIDPRDELVTGDMGVPVAVGDNTHGDTEPKIRILDGYGLGFHKWTGEQHDLSGSKYFFRTLAKIESLNWSSGSSAGGQVLEIHGRGFPEGHSTVTVQIDGFDCDPIYSSDELIMCITGEQTEEPTETDFLGGAGLLKEVWLNQGSGMDFSSLETPDISTIVGNPQIPIEQGEYVKTRFSGYFKAPATGDYVFFIASDDNAHVFLGNDDDPETPVQIIDFNSWDAMRDYFVRENAQSEPISLTAGVSYRIEIRHYNGGGPGHFSLGVKVPGDAGSPANKMPLVQHITVQPDSIVNESQTVSITANQDIEGGKIKFYYDSNESSLIPWDETSGTWLCSEILSAFSSSLGLNNVDCEVLKPSAQEIDYTFTFTGGLSNSRPLLILETMEVLPYGSASASSTKSSGTIPIGGTFTVSFQGETSQSIEYSKDIGSIESTLNNEFAQLKFELEMNGSRSEEKNDYYFILPASLVSAGDEFTIDKTNLTGGGTSEDTPAVLVTSMMHYFPEDDLFWWVIPSDFLRTHETAPQVIVQVDGLTAVCRGDCSYTYEEAPLIETLDAVNSNGKLTLTLTGQNFKPNDLITTVTLGKADCAITTITETTIICDIDGLPAAGSHLPIVHNSEFGNYALDPSITPEEFEVSITSVSTSSGPTHGFTYLTITGEGFWPIIGDGILSVTVDGNECDIRQASLSEIDCVTPPQDPPITNASTNVSVVVTVDGKSSTTSFTYDPNLDMKVLSVSPNYASTIYNTALTITGEKFGTDKTQVKVTIGDELCLISTIIDTQIECTFLGSPKGDYDLVVERDGYGQTLPETFPVQFEIDSIDVSQGSEFGGTTLTITGSGFSDDILTLQVHINDQDHKCTITSCAENEIVCVTPPRKDPLLTNEDYIVKVIGKLEEVADCLSTCTFQWTESISPTITELSTDSAKAGDTITVTGTNFGSDHTKIELSFGDVVGVASNAVDVSFDVVVPEVQGPSVAISLLVTDRGFAGHETIELSIGVVVSSVSPSSISWGGGVITITGSGFRDTLTVAVGNLDCEITEVTNTSLTCAVLADLSADETKDVSITDEDAVAHTCDTAANCQVTFSETVTPKITGHSGDLTINGSDLTGAEVKVGDHSCNVSSNDGSTIVCVAIAPPGTHKVTLFVDGKGFATGSFDYEVVLSVTAPAALDSSFAGGVSLTFTGYGLHESASVEVCGIPAEITEALGDSLTIETPLMLTERSIQDIFLTPSYITDFTQIGSETNNIFKAFDGVLTNSYSDSDYQGDGDSIWVGIDMGSSKKLLLYSIEFMGGGSSSTNYMLTVGTQVQKSSDGTNWETIHTYTAVNNLWNTWEVLGNTGIIDSETQVHVAQYFRLYKENHDSNYRINEIRIKGYLLQASDSDTLSCDVEITYPESDLRRRRLVTSAALVNYDIAITPTITNVSPVYGTVLGGTVVTITGTNFGATVAVGDVEVLIDGIACVVSAASDTSITCTTGPKPELSETTFEVTITGRGSAATNLFEFLYGEPWSSETTWGGLSPPREGETVYIPKNQNVVLDTSTPRLGLILIEGTLVVDDPDDLSAEPITLNADYIMVYHGKFIIGKEEAPYQHKVNIVLHGIKDEEEIPIFGNKVLAVSDGELEIHGTPPSHVWTELAQTAAAGDTTITLMVEVNWNVGDEIVIAPTSFESKEAEKRTIQSVSGFTVTLDEPLTYEHVSVEETYGSKTIEMRAEVGLLTRNVRIMGDESSATSQHGATVMLATPNNSGVRGRIENAEFYRVGQAFAMGRYPIHFHRPGNAQDSYVRNNAIHETYNRAVTMHGVHYLRVVNNVAYKTMGHTFFVEDGIETMNLVEGNLAVDTRASHSLLNTDSTPASFWITNFQNFFRGNHAAGSERYGFWFDPPDHPTGPSSTYDVCPMYEPLGQFEGNVAHSNGRYGLRIFHGHIPVENPCDPVKNSKKKIWWEDNPAVTAVYKDLTSWSNVRNGAIIDDAGDVWFQNFKVAHNKQHGIEMGWTEFSEPFTTARITDCLVIGKSPNLSGSVSGAKGIITAQTDGMLVENVQFFNFEEDMWPIGDESKSRHPNVRDYGGRLHKLSGLSFTDSHRRIFWDIPERGIFLDQDGSLTGTAGDYVATEWPHLLIPECTVSADHDAVVCPSNLPIRRVLFHAQQPFNRFNNKPVRISRISGSDTADLPTAFSEVPMVTACSKKFPLKSWAIPFVTMHAYNIQWGDDTPMDWEHIQIEIDTFEGDEYVIINMDVVDHREHYEAYRKNNYNTDTGKFEYTEYTVTENETLDGTETSGTYLWSNRTDVEVAEDETPEPGFFTMTLNNNLENPNEFEYIRIDGYRCWEDSCVEEEPEEEGITGEYLWSDPLIWPMGRIPIEGDSIWIYENWNMTIDVSDIPVLTRMEVNGILRFSSDIDITLRAKQIYVRRGSIVSGSADNPLPEDITHTIELHGEGTDPTLVLSSNVEAGNKVLANIGTVEMYGAPRTSWSLLEQNAKPGDSFIFVEDVDWKAGDTIAIASSGFTDDEVEEFTILDVTDVQDATTGDVDSAWTTKNNDRALGQRTSLDSTIHTATVAITDLDGYKKVSLSGSIQHYHSGTILNFEGKTIDMRTEVTLLNRNIKIIGSSGENWACTILTTEKEDVGVLRAGSTTLSNVEIDNCGQFDLERAAIRFEQSSSVTGMIDSCVIKHSQTWAVFLDRVSGVTFTDSVIFKPRWRGVVATKLSNSIIDHNVIIQVIAREVEEPNVDKPCGFFICFGSGECTNVQVTDNHVAGGQFAGFIASPGTCTNSADFQGNSVHSSDHGLIIANAYGTCLTAVDFTAFFNQHAVGAVASVNTLMLNNFSLAENVLGIALKVGGTEPETFNIIFTGGVYAGTTQHSESVNCPSRIGFLTTFSETNSLSISLNDKIKTPLHNSKADGNVRGDGSVSGVTFANFQDCDNDAQFAFQSNPLSPDFTLPHYFENMNFIKVEENAYFYMNDPNPGWANPEDCVEFVCTGPWNNLIVDTDGSLLGGTTEGVVLPNNSGIAKDVLCQEFTPGNAYKCFYSETQQQHYQVMIFESLDDDSRDRTISPIEIISHGVAFVSVDNTGFYNKLNSYMDHGWDGFYTSQKRTSRFPSIVYTGHTYNVTLTGSPPDNMKFFLVGTRGRHDGVILEVKYEQPYLVEVYHNGVLIPQLEINELNPRGVSLTDPHGANRWYHDTSTLQFLLKDETEIYLRLSDSLIINMHIEMTTEEFFADDGETRFIDKIAGVLNIPSYRIRVAKVEEGSVLLTIFVMEDATAEDTTEELKSVEENFKISIESGEMGEVIGAVIIEVDTTLSVTEEKTVIAVPEDDEEDNESIEDYAIIIIVGSGIILLVIVGLVLYFYCSKKQRLATTVIPLGSPESYDKEKKILDDDLIFTKLDRNKAGNQEPDFEDEIIRNMRRSQTAKITEKL